MAKKKRDEDLFDRLRSLGIRKGAARKVSSRSATAAARRQRTQGWWLAAQPLDAKSG